MKTFPLRTTWITVIAILSGLLATRADLSHRYSFNTNANDLVGTANGTLQGGAQIANNAVQLDGAQSYVELPPQLISGYPALTVEAWINSSINGNWSRVFDFGNTNPNTGSGLSYIFLSPHTGSGGLRLAVSEVTQGNNREEFIDYPASLDEQGPQHLAAVYDPTNNYLALYLNGALVGSRRDITIPFSAITNTFSYIGRSLYSPDPYYIGSIDEFRVYNHALGPVELAASFASGPDNPSTNAGPLQTISLQVESTLVLNGVANAQVFGNFQNVSNVNISTFPEVSYQSSDTNILQVSTNGALRATGVGTANLITSYLDQRVTNMITVVSAPPPSLKNRYSFSEAATATEAVDTVGGANGQIVGTGASFTNGQLRLPGGDAGSDAAYVNLPNGIISARTNLTIEAWVTWNGANNWQRIFDMGSSAAGEDLASNGTTYLQMTPQTGTGLLMFEVVDNLGGRPRSFVEYRTSLPIGQQTYVAAVYNYSERTVKLYVNGQLVAANRAEIPLDIIPDVNNWLGRSNFGPDPFFNGLYNEFRIWEGALSDIAIALSAAAGPDQLPISDPGAFQSISLEMTNSIYLGALNQSVLRANFANASNVDATAFAGVTFTSSNTNILTVATNGFVEAMNYGTADIIASYSGQTVTNSVTVVPAPGVPAEPVLVHRYSFNEAGDVTTVEDSVGNADGAVVGNATFTGTGLLDLPGGASGSDAGYVDLPNGIISALTNATFEAWLIWRGGPAWQRIFDFGNNTGGEDQLGNGTTYLQLTPRNGNNDRIMFESIDNPGGTPRTTLYGNAIFPSNTNTHIAVSYNAVAGSARLYVNGERVARDNVTIQLKQIPDVNNWLGRSNWQDPLLNGQFDEFRIYSGALTDNQIAASFAAGPNNLPSTNETVNVTFQRSGTNLVVSWPASATDYSLEASSQLGSGANWAPANVTTTEVNGLIQATIPITDTTRFFRLRK